MRKYCQIESCQQRFQQISDAGSRLKAADGLLAAI
jgi:hypothetical protein